MCAKNNCKLKKFWDQNKNHISKKYEWFNHYLQHQYHYYYYHYHHQNHPSNSFHYQLTQRHCQRQVLTDVEKSIILYVFSSPLIQINLVILIKTSNSVFSINITCKIYIIFAILSESRKSLLYSWWVFAPFQQNL